MEHPLLTPEEISALLGKSGAPSPKAAPGDRSFPTNTSSRRASWLNTSLRRELELLHNKVAQHFATSLAEWLRTWSEVRLLAIEESSWEEIANRFDDPTCFCVIRAKPPLESCYLELNLGTVFPLIDRLLGGGQVPVSPMHRDLTDIELRLMQRVASLWVEQLCDRLDKTSDSTLTVHRVGNHASEAEAAVSRDTLAMMRFEISFGDVRGHMHWCLSQAVVEKIVIPGSRSSQASEDAQAGCAAEGTEWVQLSVHIPQSHLAREEARSIRIGDLIATEHAIDVPVVVCLDGQPSHHAQLVACENRKGVRIVGAAQADDSQG